MAAVLKRSALCAFLCPLLFWTPLARTAAVTTSGTRNEYTYTRLSFIMHWSDANSKCSGNLLWLEDMSEWNWIKSHFGLPRSVNCWLAARTGDTTWPNGMPFPKDITLTSTGPQSYCYMIYVDQMMPTACSAGVTAICKSGRPCAPENRASLNFNLVGSNRRQGALGSELQSLTEASLIDCARRCQGNKSCCAFEMREASGRCRLLPNVDQGQWVAEEGSQIFSVEV